MVKLHEIIVLVLVLIQFIIFYKLFFEKVYIFSSIIIPIKIISQVSQIIPIISTKDLIDEFQPIISSFEWLDLDLDQIIFNRANYDMSKCRLCNVQIKGNTANSSPRDLVLSLVYGRRYYNVFTFIRTLRSTGSKSTCIVLADNDFLEYMSNNLKTQVENCNVIWINYGKLKIFNGYNEIKTRFLVIKLFLIRFRHLFNRVILHDIFDTFFQLDPFRTDFDNSTLHFTTEGDTLITNKYNIGWIIEIDPNFQREFYQDKRVICAGLMYGGAEPLYQMLLKYANIDRWKQVGHDFNDQGLLNYMFYHNEFDKNVFVDTEAVNMISATNWWFDQNPNERGLMVVSESQKIPTAVHQYDRICPLTRHLTKICPSVDGIKTVHSSHWLIPLQRCY